MSARVLTGMGLRMGFAVVASLALGCSGRLDFDPDATGTTAPARAGAEDPGAGSGTETPSGPSQPAPARSPGNEPAGPAPGAMPSAPAPTAMTPDAGPAVPTPPSATPPMPAGCTNLEALDIIVAKCGKCHGEQSPTKGLDLVSPGLLTRLVDVRSTCQGRPLLEEGPTGGAIGFFIDKLDGPVTGCGVQMPFGVPPLTEAERTCLDTWANDVVVRVKMGVTP